MPRSAVRIIARRTLREFVESRAGQKDQAALKAALDAWFDEVKKAAWTSTAGLEDVAAERLLSQEKLEKRTSRWTGG